MRLPAALVLAGGRSERMPGPSKLTRAWNDTTVLGAVVRTARAAGLSPVVVAVREDEALPGSEGADARVPVPAGGGRADSLGAGLEQMVAGEVVVLLGDEPAVDAGVVRALVEACRAAGADAGRVRYTDRPGHPVWLGPAARAVAVTLSGEAAVWEAVSRPPLQGFVLEVDRRAPIDVDSPDDLERARRRHGGR